MSITDAERLEGVVSSALELAASGDHPLSDVRRAVIAAELRRCREAQGLPVKVTDPDTLRRIAAMIRRAPANGRRHAKAA